MSIVKFVLLLSAVYLGSLILSSVLTNYRIIILGTNIILACLIVSAVIFLIIICAFALVLAIIKKPVIEGGDYRIERIKGKEE
jgi:hypothetical protein